MFDKKLTNKNAVIYVYFLNWLELEKYLETSKFNFLNISLIYVIKTQNLYLKTFKKVRGKA